MSKQTMEDLELAKDEAEIRAVAARHIDLRHWDVAKRKFADHLLAKYTPKELDALSSAKRVKVVDAFFAEYAKKNPGLAPLN